MKETHSTQKPLKESLLERIESENVCPKSRLFYRSRECLTWSLWALSVVVGAFAVAISLFVAIHHQYAFYEATHDNLFTFLVDTLPYLWIITFGLMVFVAVYNIRHTSRGYRYSLGLIMISSVLLSFVSGSALQMFGFGYSIDKILGESMSMYMSQEKLDQKMWQNPGEGRLLGRQVLRTVAPTSTVIFEDNNGQRWRININELSDRDVGLLASGKVVKLLGEEINTDMYIFHACGAFPWMMGRDVRISDLSEERKVFVERVNSFAVKAGEEVRGNQSDSVLVPERDGQSICSGIKSVRRMPQLAPR